MFLYTTIEAIVGVVAGILIAVCTKKADGVTYRTYSDFVFSFSRKPAASSELRKEQNCVNKKDNHIIDGVMPLTFRVRLFTDRWRRK